MIIIISRRIKLNDLETVIVYDTDEKFYIDRKFKDL